MVGLMATSTMAVWKVTGAALWEVFIDVSPEEGSTSIYSSQQASAVETLPVRIPTSACLDR